MKQYGKYRITEAEHLRRKKNFNYATASMKLSGSDLTNAPDNVYYQMWIDGDLTNEELRKHLANFPPPNSRLS